MFEVKDWQDGPEQKRELKDAVQVQRPGLGDNAFTFIKLTLIFIWELIVIFKFWVSGLFAKPKSLRGKVCLVTGSGRGLGRELSLALAREGAVLACADINDTNNKDTVKLIREMGAVAKDYIVNIASKSEVDELIIQVEKDLGPIYLLVNNAGIIVSLKEINEEVVRSTFNVNTLGPIWAANAVLPGMKSRNEGHIVNISSEASFAPYFPLKIYGSSKAAFSSYSRCLRQELDVLRPNNQIKVTTVHPTFISTSKDYTSMLISSFQLFYNVDYVVETVMDAIKYDKEEVVIPGYRKYFAMFFQLLPSRIFNNVMFSVVNGTRYPTEEQLYNMPVGDIVKSSNFVSNGNKL